MADLVALHRRRRDRWLRVGLLVLLIGVLVRIRHGWFVWSEPLIGTGSTWVWCLVMAAYHQGWLRGCAAVPASGEPVAPTGGSSWEQSGREGQ